MFSAFVPELIDPFVSDVVWTLMAYWPAGRLPTGNVHHLLWLGSQPLLAPFGICAGLPATLFGS